MLKNTYFLHFKASLILLFLFFAIFGQVNAGPGDLNFDGVFEVAIDLPRILFLLKRDFNGPPLDVNGTFLTNYAFLDTGASGVLLSKETVDYLEVSIDPNAQYADVGVTGIELFDVSELLYMGTADYSDTDPNDPNHYLLSGPWRFQVEQNYAGDPPNEPLDILGVPVMAGKTVVLNAGATNNLEYFSADITESNDPNIPDVDFTVPLRFEKYINPSDPNNIPPLPVIAYNPVIDNVIADYNGTSVAGTWLLDTGGTISFMSGAQASVLGLTEPNARPLIAPDFVIKVMGVGGGDVNIPGFEIDNLTIPTLNGYNLVYNNARIGVHNIGIVDEETGHFLILDGIFGSNFLCASAKFDANSELVDLAEGPYKTVIIDTQNAFLGFDVNDVYPLPACGDVNHPKPTADFTGDCKVNFLDLYVFTGKWLRDDCNIGNGFCEGADINANGEVDLADYVLLAGQWLTSPFCSACGDTEHPWPEGDFNRDCSIDLLDLQIFVEEWLNECDWLNWNCRGSDLDFDGTVDFHDYAIFVR